MRCDPAREPARPCTPLRVTVDVKGSRRAPSLMARCAALYFGRTSPRLPSSRHRDSVCLCGMHAGVGVLVCEAFRECSEQRANKYPAAACKIGRRSQRKRSSYKSGQQRFDVFRAEFGEVLVDLGGAAKDVSRLEEVFRAVHA